MPWRSLSRSLISGGETLLRISSLSRHTNPCTLEKSCGAIARSASRSSWTVIGPSLLQTKSTCSSRIVRSGSAATWPPTKMMGCCRVEVLDGAAGRTGGNHLLRRRGRLMTKYDHPDQPRPARVHLRRDRLRSPAFGFGIDDFDACNRGRAHIRRSAGTTAAARPPSVRRPILINPISCIWIDQQEIRRFCSHTTSLRTRFVRASYGTRL